MTKKEIKDLAKEIMKEMDKKGLDMEIVLDEDQLEKLADSIVDKLLTSYIREQATWYSTSTMDDIYNTFRSRPKRRTKKQMTESDLLSELAKLMTLMNLYTDKEQYEKCALLKARIRDIKRKLKQIENDEI